MLFLLFLMSPLKYLLIHSSNRHLWRTNSVSGTGLHMEKKKDRRFGVGEAKEVNKQANK